MEALFRDVLTLVALIVVMVVAFRMFMRNMPGGRRSGSGGGGGGAGGFFLATMFIWLLTVSGKAILAVLEALYWMALQLGHTIGLVTKQAIANYTANRVRQSQEQEAEHFRRWQQDLRGSRNSGDG